jgi:hypothetical protein
MSDFRVRRSRLFRATPRRHPDADTSFGSQTAHGRQTVREPDVRMSRRYEPAAPPTWILNQTVLVRRRRLAAGGIKPRATGSAVIPICRYLRSRTLSTSRTCCTPSAVGARRRLQVGKRADGVKRFRAYGRWPHRTELPNDSTESRATPWQKPLRTTFCCVRSHPIAGSRGHPAVLYAAAGAGPFDCSAPPPVVSCRCLGLGAADGARSDYRRLSDWSRVRAQCRGVERAESCGSCGALGAAGGRRPEFRDGARRVPDCVRPFGVTTHRCHGLTAPRSVPPHIWEGGSRNR